VHLEFYFLRIKKNKLSILKEINLLH